MIDFNIHDFSHRGTGAKKKNINVGLILLSIGLVVEMINFGIMLEGHFHPGVVLLLSIIAFVLIVVGVWRDKKDMRRQRDKAIGWIK